MLQAEVDKTRFSRFFIRRLPRTLSQAEALDVFWLKIWKYTTIALEADDEILVARLLDRKTSVDLTIKTKKIRNRYQEYNEKTAPLGIIKSKGNFMR
jgi:adenylate kinase